MGVGITVADDNLVVLGNTILSDVHDRIATIPTIGDSLTNGALINVSSDRLCSRQVLPVDRPMHDRLFSSS